ncbi:MAG: methyltransferase domain protein [Verrucomicrobiales bacterium]|nr:methyltransferase domain protein [Verrucomicrobiales bacterium]
MTDETTSWAVFQNAQGLETRASIVRLTKHSVIFELYSPMALVRVSEVLSEFKIYLHDRPAYYGRAVVSNLVNTGSVLVCEVTLGDFWMESGIGGTSGNADDIGKAFVGFFSHWEKYYRILPEYKITVADLQTFLTELRLWLDQVELGIRSNPSADRIQLERDVAKALGRSTTPAITTLFEKFERVAEQVEPNLQAAHRHFAKRQLHPVLLCAPFLYRTFEKPLGYAGDYEMVNMIVRDPLEGGSLFAKILNLWFLEQAPAEAHRNRISYLCEQITNVTVRAMEQGKRARILSLGCGPAGEVQKFIREKHFADCAEFFLMDFNEETLAHTQGVIEEAKRHNGRNTRVEFIKKSVNQILKEAGRRIEKPAEEQYDLVYCAGLFDYLSDQLCYRISEILYDWAAPGGMFISTNVDSSNPRRLTMDYIMEWHLIYRNGVELAGLKPIAVKDDYKVLSDITGVNVYFEARKPKHG